MLRVEGIWAKGRHNPLFGPTSFSVEHGQVAIIQADSQLERTALSLTLTGRMKPSGGRISFAASENSRVQTPRLKNLRARSELIDSPDINEPENHMRVRDYVSEMLSYTMPPFSRPRSKKWLAENGLQDLDNLWNEQVTGEQNIRLMSALAASYTHADLLVFDTPSRHLSHTQMWLPYLQELAEDPDQPRVVLAVVPHISSSWQGVRATVGSAHQQFDQDGAPGGSLRWEESLLTKSQKGQEAQENSAPLLTDLIDSRGEKA